MEKRNNIIFKNGKTYAKEIFSMTQLKT